jgi:hypothetical protein
MSFPKTPWAGRMPDKCDICQKPLSVCSAGSQTFVDGATVLGPWGNMGEGCFASYGVGIGTGKGQRYSLVTGEKLEG